MPRIRRRASRAHARLTVTQLDSLVNGHDFFREWAPMRAPEHVRLAAMREAWVVLGPDLLALHIAHHPGSRPWAWWAWDAPAYRARVDGLRHPHEDGSVPTSHQGLYYGLPGFLQTEDHFDALYESQADYLQRLKLLTANERRKLQYGDWACTDVVHEDAPQLTLAILQAWYGDHDAS